MLSFNQHSVPDANGYTEVWAKNQTYWTTNSVLEVNNQIEPRLQQEQTGCLSVSSQSWQEQSAATYFHSFQNSYSETNQNCNQFQVNHLPVQQQPMCYPGTRQINHLQSYSNLARSHQARITLVPNTKGGFKAIVKRKRKRTMFTTEQIEALEAVFIRKPYVTREDRQVLSEQLQITDTSVKVWFQNRRLRGKRELEQAIDEASELYEENHEPFYSTNSVQSSAEVSSNSNYSSAHLNYLESELTQKADESGYISLDEKAINDIVKVIDTVLCHDVSLDLPKTSDKVIEASTKEDLGDSDESVYAGSIYEPISPAGSGSVDEETPRWQRTAPEQSLKRLFDLHFC